jgi:hypothetical protein
MQGRVWTGACRQAERPGQPARTFPTEASQRPLSPVNVSLGLLEERVETALPAPGSLVSRGACIRLGELPIAHPVTAIERDCSADPAGHPQAPQISRRTSPRAAHISTLSSRNVGVPTRGWLQGDTIRDPH